MLEDILEYIAKTKWNNR